MQQIDVLKTRREHIRWLLLLAINYGRPVAMHESVLLTTIRGIYTNSTPHEIRKELDYLAQRKTLKVEKSPSGSWKAELTALGIDIVEYTVDVLPGIARPEKYWEGDHAT